MTSISGVLKVGFFFVGQGAGQHTTGVSTGTLAGAIAKTISSRPKNV
jgi:hypothetical protein